MDFNIEDYEEEKNFILNNPATPTLKLMRDFAKYYCKKQLRLGGVGSSNKVDYKEGFELAKSYIDESPCDPDIYKEQLVAWDKYKLWLKINNLT